MSSNPVLYLGQSAVQVGMETDRLCRQEQLQQAPSVFADSRACYGGSKTSIPVMDVSMPHLFAYPSDNSSNVESIMSQLLRKMEACDNPNSISIVADMCSGVGASLSSAILAEIKELAPHVRLHSAFMMPPENTIQGINVLNGVMTMQMSMEYADSVIIRGFDDALDLVSESKQCSLDPGQSLLKDMHTAIAADLYCALGPRRVSCEDAALDMLDSRLDGAVAAGGAVGNSVFSSDTMLSGFDSLPSTGVGAMYAWPSGNCSAGAGKFCDVRSSLWRLYDTHLRAAKKSGNTSKRGGTGANAKAEKYSPIRALAANMHCLHLASERLAEEDASYASSPGNSTKSNGSSNGYGHNNGPGGWSSLDACVQSATLGQFGAEPTLHVPVAGAGRERDTGSCRRLVLSPDTAGMECFGTDPSEVSALLSWACPGITFPQHLGRHTYRDKSSGQTVKLGIGKHHYQGRSRTHSSGATNVSASARTQQPQHQRGSDSDSFQTSQNQSYSRRGGSEDHQAEAEAPTIAAISFASPYARYTAKRVYNRAQDLFDRRAYIARYSDVGVEELDFELGLNYLSEQLLD